MTKHTSGPWFEDKKGRVWRRHPSELYENGGGVAGDMPIATVERGWYGEGKQGYPVEANARLIAAAPDLLAALQGIIEAEHSEGRGGSGFSLKAPTREHQQRVYQAWQKAYAAIAKATSAEIGKTQ